MSEQFPEPVQTPEASAITDIEKRRHDRRTVVRGALAAIALGSVTSWGVYERLTQKDGSAPNDPIEGVPSPAATDMGPTETAFAETESSTPLALGEAEMLRQLLEEEGEEALVAAFRISKEQAGTPSQFAEEFARNVGRWISAGCTPAEIAGYTSETLTDYQAEMRDKYGVAAAAGLGEPASVDSLENSGVQSSALFKNISELHDQVLEYYMNVVHGGNTSPTTIEVTVVQPPEMGSPDPYSHRYPLELELSFKVANEQTEPIVAAGKFNVVLHAATEFYEIELDDSQPIPLFAPEAA